MSNDNMCGKCSQRVDVGTELFTVCEGDCALFYHATCTGLTEREVIVLSPNFIWFCEKCLYRFRTERERKNGDGVRSNSSQATGTVNNDANEKTMRNELAELKDTVAGILKTLARCDTSDSPTDSPMLQSTPISSSLALQDGTNVSNMIVHNDCSKQQSAITDDGQFSLLLTNVDTSVTESDIHSMVSQSLGFGTVRPEYIDVAKLVSKWKSCRTIDYVSFRVVLDSHWKFKALDPSTWPKGLKFREFIRRPSVPWKPVS